MGDYPRHTSGRLLYPWEIPARPGGGATAEEGPNPVVTTPSWMRDGLALKGDEVPTLLWLPRILPVLDAYQDGWGIARYLVGVDGTGAFLVLGGAEPTVGVLLSEDETVIRRVIEIQAFHGAAGTQRLDLEVLTLAAAPSNVFATSITIAAGVTLGTAQILGGHPLILPPRFTLRARATTLVGAEEMRVQFHFVSMPTGFHAPAY